MSATEYSDFIQCLSGWSDKISSLKTKVVNADSVSPLGNGASTSVFGSLDKGGVGSYDLLNLIQELQERVTVLESKKDTQAINFMLLG